MINAMTSNMGEPAEGAQPEKDAAEPPSTANTSTGPAAFGASGPADGESSTHQSKESNQSPPTSQPNPTETAGNPWAAWDTGGRPPLRRAREGKMLAGVCAGLARATKTDPVLFRVILGVLVFFGGIGALIYLLAWLFLPADGDDAAPVQTLMHSGTSTTNATLTVILVVATLILGAMVLDQDPGMLLLVAAVGVGVGLLVRREGAGAGPKQWMPANPAMPAGYPPPSYQPYGATAGQPAYAATNQTESGLPDPAHTAGSNTDPAQYASGTAYYQPNSVGGYSVPEPPTNPYYATPAPQAGFAPHGPYATRKAARPPRPPRERSPLGRLTLAAICVVLGALLVVDISGVSVTAGMYLGAALVTTAAGLLIGAFFGRARGLIALGVILTLALGVAETSRWVSDHWEFEENRHHPSTFADLEPSYDVSSGEVHLDLRDLDFSGQNRTVKIDVGLGEAEVILPDNVNVTARANVGVGSVEVFDEEAGGVGLERHSRDAGTNDGGKLIISVHVGVGEANIVRASQASPASAMAVK